MLRAAARPSPKQDHLVKGSTSCFNSVYAFLDDAEADIVQLGGWKGREERSDQLLAEGRLHSHRCHITTQTGGGRKGGSGRCSGRRGTGTAVAPGVMQQAHGAHPSAASCSDPAPPAACRAALPLARPEIYVYSWSKY